MANPANPFTDPNLAALRDESLADRTRAHHRNLLLMSTSAILIAQLNLVPQRISALDVRLQKSDQHAIRIVTGIAVVYFLILFLASALPDFFLWRENRRARIQMIGQLEQEIKGAGERITKGEEKLAEGGADLSGTASSVEAYRQNLVDHTYRRATYRRLALAVFAKAAIDFALPIAIALIALAALSFGPVHGWR